jgi:hypothetical protein
VLISYLKWGQLLLPVGGPCEIRDQHRFHTILLSSSSTFKVLVCLCFPYFRAICPGTSGPSTNLYSLYLWVSHSQIQPMEDWKYWGRVTFVLNRSRFSFPKQYSVAAISITLPLCWVLQVFRGDLKYMGEYTYIICNTVPIYRRDLSIC